jgi:hypothetical protein
MVYLGKANSLEDCLQSWEVAVNIIDGSDPHG